MPRLGEMMCLDMRAKAVLIAALALLGLLTRPAEAEAAAAQGATDPRTPCVALSRGSTPTSHDGLPGWRDRYRSTAISLGAGAHDPPVRISSASGVAGIDQTVLVPPTPFTIEIRGRVMSGRGRLVVGWRAKGRVEERERALEFDGGSRTYSFEPPSDDQPLGVTVAVVQLTRTGVIELDEVALFAGSRQLLRNSELAAGNCPEGETRALEQACSTRHGEPVHADFVPIALAGWRDRYSPMSVTVARSRPTGPVRMSSRYGRSGIDQAVVVPSGRLVITVRGSLVFGKARLVLGWRENGKVRELERPLKLRGGVQRYRLRLPSVGNRMTLTVGVVQLTPGGVVELDAITLRSRGAQALRNPSLAAHLCRPGGPANITQLCLFRTARPAQTGALAIVPGWRERFADMAVVIHRRPAVSPPLRFVGEESAGIDQVVPLPRGRFTVTVYGRRTAGRLLLIVGWTNDRRSYEEERKLELREGVERHRFALAPNRPRLDVRIGIVREAGASASLDAVSLESKGTQRLANPYLYATVCPPPPRKPDASFAAPVGVRGIFTLLLLLGVGVGIRKVGREREARN